jgi:hypothetical protein
VQDVGVRILSWEASESLGGTVGVSSRSSELRCF